jgi:ADP-ribose pyrophosphatase
MGEGGIRVEFRFAERSFEVRGRTFTHRFLVLDPVVAVVAVDEGGRVLLVRQYRAALDRRTLEVPAGYVEPGEAWEAAAARELEEETGYRARRLEPVLTYWPAPGFCDQEVRIFRAEGLEAGATRFDPGEDLELVRLDPEACRAAIRDGGIRDGKTLVALFAAVLGPRP